MEEKSGMEAIWSRSEKQEIGNSQAISPGSWKSHRWLIVHQSQHQPHLKRRKHGIRSDNSPKITTNTQSAVEMSGNVGQQVHLEKWLLC